MAAQLLVDLTGRLGPQAALDVVGQRARGDRDLRVAVPDEFGPAAALALGPAHQLMLGGLQLRQIQRDHPALELGRLPLDHPAGDLGREQAGQDRRTAKRLGVRHVDRAGPGAGREVALDLPVGRQPLGQAAPASGLPVFHQRAEPDGPARCLGQQPWPRPRREQPVKLVEARVKVVVRDHHDQGVLTFGGRADAAPRDRHALGGKGRYHAVPAPSASSTTATVAAAQGRLGLARIDAGRVPVGDLVFGQLRVPIRDPPEQLELADGADRLRQRKLIADGFGDLGNGVVPIEIRQYRDRPPALDHDVPILRDQEDAVGGADLSSKICL